MKYLFRKSKFHTHAKFFKPKILDVAKPTTPEVHSSCKT